MDDAIDIAGMLVATGRAIKPSRWVPEMMRAAEAAQWEAIGST